MNALRKPFRYSYGNAAFILIGVNLLVFMAQNAFSGLTSYLALSPRAVLGAGALWQFVTYMFAHASVSHLLVNMLGLFFFGPPVEKRIGTKEFLLFYFLTGIAAGLFSFAVYLVTGAYYVSLLGASGALFAVLLAYASFYPDSRIFIWGLIPVRAPFMVLGYAAIELFAAVGGRSGGVAHLTHLAGFAFAWAYFVVRFGVNPWRALFGDTRR